MIGSMSERAKSLLRSRVKEMDSGRVAELVTEGIAESDSGGRIMQMILQHHEDELAMRRAWAERIRQEFGKYHEHEGGHPCGACGSIQAANWMDPDHTGDGPLAEPYGTWRDRQS